MTDAYICIIECEENHLYVGSPYRIQLGDLVPKRIIGLYSVEQNYRLFQRTRTPASQHIDKIMSDYEMKPKELIETILSDRCFYDRQKGSWYNVRTCNMKQNDWLAEVAIGYKNAARSGDYYASCRVSHLKAEEVDQRPVCDHGYLCEVHFSRIDQQPYYDCPVKYVWPDFMPTLERIKPCVFRQLIKSGI